MIKYTFHSDVSALSDMRSQSAYISDSSLAVSSTGQDHEFLADMSTSINEVTHWIGAGTLVTNATRLSSGGKLRLLLVPSPPMLATGDEYSNVPIQSANSLARMNSFIRARSVSLSGFRKRSSPYPSGVPGDLFFPNHAVYDDTWLDGDTMEDLSHLKFEFAPTQTVRFAFTKGGNQDSAKELKNTQTSLRHSQSGSYAQALGASLCYIDCLNEASNLYLRTIRSRPSDNQAISSGDMTIFGASQAISASEFNYATIYSLMAEQASSTVETMAFASALGALAGLVSRTGESANDQMRRFQTPTMTYGLGAHTALREDLSNLNEVASAGSDLVAIKVHTGGSLSPGSFAQSLFAAGDPLTLETIPIFSGSKGSFKVFRHFLTNMRVPSSTNMHSGFRFNGSTRLYYSSIDPFKDGHPILTPFKVRRWTTGSFPSFTFRLYEDHSPDNEHAWGGSVAKITWRYDSNDL